ncbi:N-acetylmuramoyl-L-alanine amidase [Lysinibacillus sp. 54212]|uniref:N-acetylmuramoyl-L-alanine amidase n=1 Tax=Lysinibacillus sp. 54212 TaxID=3119829 RepID=UPI002FC9DD1B
MISGQAVATHLRAARVVVEWMKHALLILHWHSSRGVKQADFYVLKHTRAPALLLEIGFIDNSKDNMLFDSRFEAVAEGVAAAIIKGERRLENVRLMGRE